MADRDNIEDKGGEEKKTWLGRQKESYQQQTSWVWRPEYTVHVWWSRFLYMGAFMLIFGSGLICFAGGANEIELDYTDWKCNSNQENASEYLIKNGKSTIIIVLLVNYPFRSFLYSFRITEYKC